MTMEWDNGTRSQSHNGDVEASADELGVIQRPGVPSKH